MSSPPRSPRICVTATSGPPDRGLGFYLIASAGIPRRSRAVGAAGGRVLQRCRRREADHSLSCAAPRAPLFLFVLNRHVERGGEDGFCQFQCANRQLERWSVLGSQFRLSAGLYLHSGPLFHRLNDLRDVRIGALKRFCNPHKLSYSITDNHRHAEALSLLKTKPYVLIEKLGRKTEIKFPGEDASRKLIGSCRIAAATGIDNIKHDRRIETGLGSHHKSFRRDRNGGGRQKIVAKLHRLPKAGLFADPKHLTNNAEDWRQFARQTLRARNHNRKRSFFGTRWAAAYWRIDGDDALLFQALGNLARNAGTGRRQIN